MAQKRTLKKLGPRHREAIGHLLGGKTYSETGRLVGVTRERVAFWMGQPVFRDELASLQDATLGQVSLRLSEGANDALDVLHEVFADKKQGASLRARTARSWLDLVLRIREQNDLAARVAALEAKLEGKQ